MARKIEGWVDGDDVQKAEQSPEKYSHVIYTERSDLEGISTPATLIIGEKAFTESEVRSFVAALKDETLSKSVDHWIDFVAQRVLSLDPA